MATSKTLYLRHRDGATHALRGAKLAKLLRELKAGRGGPEVTALVASGYVETLGGLDLSSLEFDPVDKEAR